MNFPRPNPDVVLALPMAIPSKPVRRIASWSIPRFVPLLIGLAGCSPLWSETFVLKDGGRVEGEWLNADAHAPEHYKIRLDGGGELMLEAARVARVIPISPQSRQYRAWLGKMPPTAEGNWQLAKWCLRNGLPEERAFHLDEVLRLDPNHAEVRRVLGFKYVDGEWILADDLMLARGFVKHKGRWRLPQDVALLEARDATTQQIASLKKQLRLWRKAVGTERESEAISELERLQDPLATPLVIEAWEREESLPMALTWIRVLGNLPGAGASAALVRGSLDSPLKDLRHACLDQLERRGPPFPVALYCHALTSSQNARVRHAAAALERLGDASAILPLIRALVTEHREVLVEADPNRMNAAFGSGTNSSGTGFSTGNRP
ncbi:MAG TPA: hypothetical protein VIY86_03915, partial [Pirellulaceae bacterium]